MDIIPILPAQDGGEGEPAPVGDYVTISRVELEALLERAGVASPTASLPSAIPLIPALSQEGACEPLGRDSMPDPGARQFGPLAAPDVTSREPPTPREQSERELRFSELERGYKAAVRERDLATALAGKSLIPGAAVQLIKLWREDFDVYEEGGKYNVAAKDGRTVAQAVNDWLASSEYSHFCLPTSRGGSGARDASRPSAGVVPTTAPRNLGEAIVMKWREESVTRPNNFLKPIGLRRHR